MSAGSTSRERSSHIAYERGHSLRTRIRCESRFSIHLIAGLLGRWLLLDNASVFRFAVRSILGAAVALAMVCGSGAARLISGDNPKHSGTVLVSVEFYGNTGQGVVTVVTRAGHRVARHVLHQSVAGFQGVVHSKFVLKPGHYKVKLTPHLRMWTECQTLTTVNVRARRTSEVSLGFPCAVY